MQEAASRARMLARNFAQEGISLEGKTVLRTSDLHRLSAAVAAQIEAVTRHREALERHPSQRSVQRPGTLSNYI
jgi:hypothetical protein